MNETDSNARYRGDTLQCIRHGLGSYEYPGGVFSYYGKWLNGEKHGDGCEFSINLFSKYVGDFQEGEITGKGVRVWEDGRRYEGDWVLGEMHGHGDWTSSSGKDRYSGDFCNNQRHGRGKLILGKGTSYEGGFSYHKYDGVGNITISNGGISTSFLGDFTSGIITGQGRVLWEDTALYTGGWLNGIQEGKGLYQTKDHSHIFIGSWKDGMPLEVSTSLKVEYIPPPEEISTDKKGKKEKKPAAAPSKKKDKKDEHILPAIPLSPGALIPKIIVTTYPPPEVATTQRRHSQVQKKSLLQAAASLGYSSAPIFISSTPCEHTRTFHCQLRPILQDTSSVDVPPSLGETIPIWLKFPLVVHDIAARWDRYPATMLRFIDGIDPITGKRLIADIDSPTAKNMPAISSPANQSSSSSAGGASVGGGGGSVYGRQSTTSLKSLHDNNNNNNSQNAKSVTPPSTLRLSDGDLASHTLYSGDMTGTGEILGFLMDFQLDGLAIAESVTSITSLFVHRGSFKSSASPIQSPPRSPESRDGHPLKTAEKVTEKYKAVHMTSGAKQGSEFTVISVLSVTQRVHGVDHDLKLDLVLMVPNIVLEEYIRVEDLKKKREEAISQAEAMCHRAKTPNAAVIAAETRAKVEAEPIPSLQNWKWRNCVWELRLASAEDSDPEPVIPLTNSEEKGEDSQPHHISQEDLWKKQQFVMSPRYDPSKYSVLGRFEGCDLLASGWHSFALLIANQRVIQASRSIFETSSEEPLRFVIDGIELTQSSLSKETGKQMAEMLSDWLPDASFYRHPFATNDTSSAVQANSSHGGSHRKMSSGHVSIPIAIKPEDNVNTQRLVLNVGGQSFEAIVKVVGVFTETDVVDPIAMTVVFENWSQEVSRINLLMEADEKEVLEVATQANSDAAHTTDNSAVQREGKSSHSSKASGTSKKLDSAHKTKNNSNSVAPEAGPVPVKTPRDCHEVASIPVVCHGGRGEINNIIIPPNVPEGYYVFEIIDTLKPECVATDQGSTSTSTSTSPKIPEDLPKLCSVLRNFGPDCSLRFHIVNDL